MFPSLRDFQFAFRRLRKAPGFVAVCVVTLALGVGANTAVFSVMHAILLKSLPVQDPSRVYYVNTSDVPRGTSQTGLTMQTSLSYPVFEALRQEKKAFSDVMLYVPIEGYKVAVRYGAEPEEAVGDMVSGNFFSGLGVPMEWGRGLNMADETQHASTVVISYSYWERRFAKDKNIVGQTLFLKGIPFTIVGVAGPAFEGTEEARSLDLWIPLQSRVEFNAWGQPVGDDGKRMYLVDQNWWCMHLLARLADGVTPEQAVATAQAAFQRAAYLGIGNPKAGEKPPTLSLKETKGFPNVGGGLEQPLQILMGMVSLVLLIALSNVAMMLLARSNGRQREFSIRAALGARRGTLLKELLAESLLLVGVGGAMAWLFAEIATRALSAWSPQIESSLQPDRSVMLFALGILALTAVLFGLAPLHSAMNASPGGSLKTGAATASTDTGKTRFGRGVVVMQIALCLTLLVGAGLLVRSLENLQNIPLGFKSDGLVVFGVSPQAKDETASIAFYTNLLAQLQALPDVEGVTMTVNRMGSGWSNNDGGVTIDGVKVEGNSSYRNDLAAPDNFKTLGVPLVAGRDFSGSDTATSQRVMIVNESFVKKYMPKVNPLGHTTGTDKPYTIVGVVKDYKYSGMNDEPHHPMVWGAYTQGGTVGGTNVVLRVKGDPMAALPGAQRVLQSMDPNLPLERPELQQAVYDRSIAQQALFARLAGFFGLLAVVLVATGLYGVLAYRVGRRTVEIGVRMAVGAQRWQVVWMVLRDCMALMVIGMAIGVPLSIALGRQLASQLYNVKPGDAMSFAAGIVGVLVVCAGASLVPARRAASVDPIQALRAE